MPTIVCRICGRQFFEQPLLRYQNMPKAAQFLPDTMTLAGDKGIDLDVCQCSGCGLVQLRSDPVPYYREVVRAAAVSEEMKAFRLEQFENFTRRFSLKQKKVLEVGCGRGEYLSLIQQCGMIAHGLEYSKDSVAHCQAGGLKVSQGFIHSSTYELEHAPFDGFFILSFLEHLPAANAVLEGIRKNLADAAVGIVEVPNFDMIVRDRVFSEFIPDHLFYFTQQTLTATLMRSGYEIVECASVWHDYILSAIVRMPRKLDLSNFHAQQERLAKQLTDYIRRFGLKRVAVWGAGHQSLAIIALAGLADRIRYVVDSAPFKQGRYTPATHVPIVSPEILRADPVDAVIVIAGSYTDEVVRTIRTRYSTAIGLAVVRDSGLEVVP